MTEEIRRGSILVIKDDEDKITTMQDMSNFKEFKLEVLNRLDILEKEIKSLRQVKVK